MINNTTSSCPHCLMLLRMLVLHSMECNVCVFAKYISSKNNRNSDLLSRLKLDEFKRSNPQVEATSTEVPSVLWPMNKVW